MPKKDNFSYNHKPPPFLAALQAQTAGHGGPDPLLAKQRRSVKKRSSSEEAEDAPLVVDEDGNAIGVEVGKDGEVKEAYKGEVVEEDDVEGKEKNEINAQDGGKDMQSVIGGRKRKIAKVIRESDEALSSKKDGGSVEKLSEESPAANTKIKKSKKSAAKKMKLSFDDDDG